MADQDPVVQYSVKEILTRLELKLDNVINTTLRSFEERLSVVETHIAGGKATRASWYGVLTLIAALVAGGAAVIAVIHG